MLAELAAIDPGLDATFVAHTAALTELGPRSCLSDARRVKRWLYVIELVRLVTADLARRYRGLTRQIDIFDIDSLSCEYAEAYER